MTGCLVCTNGPARNLILTTANIHFLENPVNDIRIATPAFKQQRAAERVAVAVPARLTWKDQRGTTRFASVMTRNISEFGAYVECHSPIPIPLYRLVQFQLEREDRHATGIPPALRDGRMLSAVYRVTPASPGRPQGLALRLMVDPKRHVVTESTPRRATA